ncbi:MAG: DUF3090 domain-containing protein [Actinomycetota bacterium]
MDPVDKITAGAIGEPGERTFFLQARGEDELVTVVLEKQQVELLSASILELLAQVGDETGTGPGEDELDLEQPMEPRFRAGNLRIGYEPDRDMILLEVEEAVEGDDEEEGEELVPPDTDKLRLWATREQMLALSRHGSEVASRGRPTCQYCGNPIDPEGHVCPAMNGHRS